jgi:transposase
MRSKWHPLWILRTGAPWRDLPERYPPYQTCHRRFQRWIEEGVLDSVLQALAEDLEERGEIDLSECYIDGTFAVAKKGSSVCQAAAVGDARRSDLSFWKTASEMRRLRHRSASLLDFPSAIFLR